MAKINEKQMVIGFSGTLGTILLILLYMSYTQWEEIEIIRLSNAGIEENIRKEEKKQKEIDKFTSEIFQLTREYQQFADVLPDNKKLEEFFSAVRQISDELQIPPFGFKPRTSAAVKALGGAAYGTGAELTEVEVPVQFDATYEQIGQFINKIEAYQRLISVKDLSISSRNAGPPLSVAEKGTELKKPEVNELTVRLKLQTYIYNAGVKTSTSASLGTSSNSIKRGNEWTPDASRDPFIWFLQVKEKVTDTPLEEKGKVADETTEDTICRHYDLDNRCTAPRNKYSEFCDKHFSQIEVGVRQEKTLRKTKELIEKIEESFRKNDQQALSKLYVDMDEILLRQKFDVDWIKIEIEDIKQRYNKIKDENRRRNFQDLLKRALTMKTVMLNLFLEGKYVECITEFNKLQSLLVADASSGQPNPELQTILSEARNIREKAKTHIEFSELPLEIVGIIWIQKHPEESVAIIDGITKGVDDYVNHGARIVEIRKGEVIFSYKGENIARKLKTNEY
ncbi:MAG: type 4a pilus biogenesis protein PilO [Planctomycetota bacterium]